MSKLIFPHRLHGILIFFFALCSLANFAQLTVVEGAAMNMTPEQLVQNWLVGEGITISNVTYNGSSVLITSNQIGTFMAEEVAFDQLKIDAGILMTSGKASIAIGPNNSAGAGLGTNGPGDPDLTTIAGTATHDKCVLEFDFVPQSDTIRFRYVFASEEFYDYCNSINDAFGFFLSGPGITGPYSNNAVNIALMPYSSNPVTINNLCADNTSNWCNGPPNGGNGYQNCSEVPGQEFQYDGLTYVFTATYVVTACTTYHIKLAIADAQDHVYDSGVFLEKNSFNAVGLTINNNFSVPSLGERAIEGCSDAIVSFILPGPTVFPHTIHWTIGGTAVNGVDYATIPDSIVIPAGQDSSGILIQPFYDGLTEGIETVILGIQQPTCAGAEVLYDTILIHDNTPVDCQTSPDDTICFGDTAILLSQGFGSQRPYHYSWNIPGGDSVLRVSPITGTYTYIATIIDGCGLQDSDTLQLLVKPTPELLNDPKLDTICSNTPVSIGLIAAITGTSFSWSSSNPSGQITGHSAGTGTSINQLLVNHSFVLDSVVYTITPIADGCIGGDSLFTVFVKPRPDVLIQPVNTEICNGEITNIILTSNVENTLFSWTATASSPNISGYGDGTGNQIIQTLTITGFIPDTVTYHITAICNGCSSEAIDYPVIVHPVPEITVNPMFDSICPEETTHIDLTSTCAGTTYTWTAAQGVGNVNGFSNGSGPLIQQQLTNGVPTPGSVLYTITPATSHCTGPGAMFTMWVKPAPHLTNSPMSDSICSGQSTALTLQSDVAGTSFTWMANSSSGNVSGFSDNTTPTTMLDQTLVNSGIDLEWVDYTITPVAGGCVGPDSTFRVVVFPVPDLANSPPGKSVCSGSSTDLTLQSTIQGTTFTWRAFASSPTLSGFSNHTGPGVTFIGQTLVNSGFAIDTVTYRLVPSANGCPGDSVDFQVIVFPTPDLSNTPSIQTQCPGLSTSLNLTSHVANTTFTWRVYSSSPTLTGFSNQTSPGVTSINQTLVNSGFTIDTATYRLAPLANGCPGDSTDYRVVVFPVPDLANNPPSQSQCNSLNTNITLLSNVTGTTFTWRAFASSPMVNGYSSNSGTGVTSINQILTSTNNLPDTITYRLLPTANNCTGDSIDYQVVVFPTALAINIPMSQSQCNDLGTNITLISNVAIAQFTWTCTPSSGNIAGWTNNSTPSTFINQILDNSGFATENVVYHLTPVAYGCYGTTTDYVVTVFPTPDLTNTPLARQICNQNTTNIILTSNVPGSLFTWTVIPGAGNISGYTENTTSPTTILDQQLFLAGVISDSIFYHITPLANGCEGAASDFKLTVNPFPRITNHPMFDTICDLNSTLLDLEATCNGSTFVWRAQSGFGNVIGFSDGAGPTIDQVLDNQLSTPGEVQYIVTPTAYGCPGPDTTFYFLVNPTAHLTTSPLSSTVCSGESIDVPLLSDVSGSQFTWSCMASSPNLTGFSENTTPVITLDQTLFNSGYTIETVTYHITPIANGCTGIPSDFILTVNPVPNLSNDPQMQSQCNNLNTSLTLNSHVTGTTFTWSCTPSSANITGWAPNAVATTQINQVLVNTGFNLESVIYHLTPSANGCAGPLTNFTFHIVSLPDVYFNPPEETICSESTSSIQLLSHVPGTTFSWTCSASSPDLTGFVNGTGTIIAQTLTNAGTSIEQVSYMVSPEAFGCPPGGTQTVILTVNPKPVITNQNTTSEICSGTTVSIIPLSDVAGALFGWRAFGNTLNVQGFQSGSGLTISQTLINTGFDIGFITYRIAPVANGCTGDSVDFVVTVFPVADVYFHPNEQTLCSGQTCSIQNLSHVTGATFTWTATGSSSNVTGYSAGNGEVISQTLINQGYLSEAVTYVVTPLANGCMGSQQSVPVTVNPLPAVTLTVCMDTITTSVAQPVALKGGIPPGGSYQGINVNGSMFYPDRSAAGTYTITYIYTNGFGCLDSAKLGITVANPLTHSCGDPFTDIRDQQSYPTVQIGSQCWMAANLNYGTTIPSSQMQRDNCIPEKYCFQDLPELCALGSSLYQWDELMRFGESEGSQGFCPPGWHIPSETEWNELFNFYISNGFAGNPLKYNGFSGFNAALSGIHILQSTWKFGSGDPKLHASIYWSSNAHGPNKAWAHGINEVILNIDFTPSVSFYPSQRTNAFSIRCLKD